MTAFVVAACPGKPKGTAKLTVTALRSLLGFVHAEGLISQPLRHHVPAVASWRLAGLPRALEPGQVEALLAGCDQNTTVGRREFAMLTLPAQLGLRAGEVAALTLDDIDGRAGEITVRGKRAAPGGCRCRWMWARRPPPAWPMARPSRSRAPGRFLRARAPHRGLASAGVTTAVCHAGHRAGTGPVHAHRLRHSAATSTLAAEAPLAEIGQVLRYSQLASTAIYAKADIRALRVRARPWPGGAA